MTHRAEPGELFSTIFAFIEQGRPFAVATVLRADGSTPVEAGAKAVIEADGTIHGTVGGGAVEAETQRRAREAVRSETPVVFDFGLRGTRMTEASPICGGSMRLLVDPSAAGSHAHYRFAAEALARRERGIWLTTLQHRDTFSKPSSSGRESAPFSQKSERTHVRCYGLEGSSQNRVQVKSEFVPEMDLARHKGFPDAKALTACLATEKPALVASPNEEALEIFVEPLIPKPMLVIVGGGHVGQAVAAQASLLGFEIVVIEDRPEFADPRLFPLGTKTRCGVGAEALAAFPSGRDTFIVIVTRGHQQDSAALRACIRRPAAYIGMIGSRRKVPLVRQQFLDSGWATAGEFDRVHAPIGLDLGAVTVPEIAASILAQMIAVRRKGAAPRMPLT